MRKGYVLSLCVHFLALLKYCAGAFVAHFATRCHSFLLPPWTCFLFVLGVGVGGLPLVVMLGVFHVKVFSQWRIQNLSG